MHDVPREEPDPELCRGRVCGRAARAVQGFPVEPRRWPPEQPALRDARAAGDESNERAGGRGDRPGVRRGGGLDGAPVVPPKE